MNVFIKKIRQHLTVTILTLSFGSGLEAMELELTQPQDDQSTLQVELKDAKIVLEQSLLPIVHKLPGVTIDNDGLLVVPLLEEEWRLLAPCLHHLASLSRGTPEDIVIKRLKSYCMRLKGKQLALFTKVSKNLGIELLMTSAQHAGEKLHMNVQHSINDNDIVMLLTADGTDAALSCRLARVSHTLKELIESISIDEPLPLKSITAPTWSCLSSLLGKVNKLQNGTKRVHHVTENILKAIRKLNDTQLIELFSAVNYLNIPFLFSLIEKQVLTKKTMAVPVELLLPLPPMIRNRIIIHTLAHKLGPVVGSQHGKIMALGEPHTVSIDVTNGTLVIASADKKGLMWQDTTNNRQYSLESPIGLGISQVHASQGLLATYHGYALKVWNLETGKLIATCTDESQPQANARAFCFDKEGRLFSAHDDGSVHVWSTQTGEQLFRLCPQGFMSRWTLYCMCQTEDGYLATGNSSGELVLWDCTARQKVLSCLDHKAGHQVLEALCDGMDGTLIAGYTDGTIRIWNKTNGTLRAQFATSQRICSLCKAGNGMIACGTGDGSVAIFDTFSGQQLMLFLKAHKSWPTALCVTQDGRLISSAPSPDGTVRIEDLSFLKALESMNSDQVRALMSYVEKAGKEACWDEIQKIVKAKQPLRQVPEEAVSERTVSGFLLNVLKSFF